MKTVFYIIPFFILTLLYQPVTAQYNFQVGETLHYEMGYGFITGGEATLTLSEKTFNGKTVFHSRGVGKTIGIADKIFNVYDVYESYFDKTTFLPYKAIADIKEDTYTDKSVLDFDHPNQKVQSSKKGEIKLEHKLVFDIVSAFYYMRNTQFNELTPGKIVRVHTVFQDKPWDLLVRYKALETIKTEFGKIQCYKFKPVVEKGVFEDEDALSIWVTADQNKMPIKIEMDFFIGSFTAEIVKYENLKYPLQIPKK